MVDTAYRMNQKIPQSKEQWLINHVTKKYKHDTLGNNMSYLTKIYMYSFRQ